MDFKKSAFPENLNHCSAHQRRRVVYGFGIGLLACSIAFFAIFLTISINVPLLNPVFHGFNNLGSFHNTPNLFSWSFSFSSTSCSSSNCSLRIDSVDNDSSNQVDHMILREKGTRNLSKNHGIDNLLDSGRKGEVLGDAHMSNFFEKGTNGSFINQESKNLGNVSTINGQNVTIGKELRQPDTNDRGNLSLNAMSAKDSQAGGGQNGFYGDCDIFHGRWIKDNAKPFYPPGSCPFVDRDFDCHLNKRPDDEFLSWKWKPYDCDIPSLNATEFLERLRGKKMVFVGDSLNRNMWESLVCILWQSISDKSKVHEISGRREFKKNGFYAFQFEDYNCTVDFVTSKFLVRESTYKDSNGTLETLRLDLMDHSAVLYQDADVLIFNTGHWWTHEKTSKGENYYQEGELVHPKLKVHEAYKRAIATWASWVDQNIDANRTKVIFRGYSATHFRGGRWNSGGQCHRQTEPILNATHLARYPKKMKVVEHVIQEMKTPVIYLNISRLTDFRKDGHPSIYRREYKTVEERDASLSSQDCSHWCLPGVPDTWNELLYLSLLKAGQGSSTWCSLS